MTPEPLKAPFFVFRQDVQRVEVLFLREFRLDIIILQGLQIEDDPRLACFAIQAGADLPDMLAVHLDDRLFHLK